MTCKAGSIPRAYAAAMQTRSLQNEKNLAQMMSWHGPKTQQIVIVSRATFSESSWKFVHPLSV